jgi:hypothetical protein
MRPITDHQGNEVTLSDLCYFIYQGLGQHAVQDFVSAVLAPHSLSTYEKDVEWKECEPCEEITPHHKKACLVCSSSPGMDEDELRDAMREQEQHDEDGIGGEF